MPFFGAKRRQFYDYFERAAQNGLQAALALHELFAQFDRLPERVQAIKDLEHVGDQLTHDTFEHLNNTYITPINREDITALAGRLDDIVDLIDESANRVLLYRVGRPREDATGIAEILTRMTALIVETMPMIRNMRNSEKLFAKCRQIAALEKEADRASEQALASLLGSPRDPVEVIKWKDIYEDLETACNHCKHVANVIEEIVIKNK
jgi:predicted phosphate transport protein (TIGR00153 family)